MSDSTASISIGSDPYAPRPTFFQRHRDQLAPAVVFVLTVVLAVVSFPPFKSPEFAYAMLVPGVYWAYTRPRLKIFAWTMAAAQAVAWTLLLGWLYHVTWGGLLLLGPFVGVWVGSWYLAVWWTMPRMIGRPTLVRLTAMLGLAAGWVFVEWTRTWLLGGFPWLPLAASQWTMISMLQVAAYTGAYGISFVVVAVNLGFAAYAHRLFREGAIGLNKRSQEFFFALFLVLACFSLHVTETFSRGRFSEPFARVAFVQPYIPQEAKWDPSKGPGILDVLEKQTLGAAGTKPDVILWPEASTPWAVRGDDSIVRGADTMKSFVESLAKRSQSALLIGSLAIENTNKPDERWYNGAFVVTPEDGVRLDYYAKRHLVPFGEYIPLHPLLGWLTKFVPIGPDASAGADSSPLLVPIHGEPTVFGPLICYEDIFPDLARRSTRTGSSVLAVVTNNAWYGEGGAAYQHAAHAVLRAVESRRPVLRCGNGGWSGWIDEFGAVRAVLTRDAAGKISTDPRVDGTIYFRGSAVVSVTRDSRWIGQESFYTRHGDWFVAVCAVLTMLGAALLSSESAAAPTPGKRG